MKRIVCLAAGVATIAAIGGPIPPAFGQPGGEAAPIYGITIPDGYRDWRLISINHLEGGGGKVNQLRAQLGNDIAMRAFREGTLPFPDGTIIAALHWKESLSVENNKVLADGFPGAGLQSFVPDAALNVYARKFTGRYEHRTIPGGIGHNLPQEASQAFAQAIIDVDQFS